MKKLWRIMLCLVVVAGLSACGAEPYHPAPGPTDAADFRAAYEALNGQDDGDGGVYLTISIPEDNTVVILDYAQMREFLQRGDGVLYFGRPGCPWCRKMLPTLLRLTEDYDIPLYYYDPEAIRAANDDNYRALTAALDEYLDVDTVTQRADDPDFDPTRKRLVLPDLYFIREGEIVGRLLLFQNEFLQANDTDGLYRLLEQTYTECFPVK